ncbi:MAG: serine/threonine-protein kinase [Acidobacteriota bacterium]|nr:serine/threonine protein kinase [Blastocatellia bacterium]MDW8411784.1 serine/threonine-protein kinase [Acidobacteriota bacterium]
MKYCPECKRKYDDSTRFCVFDGQRLISAEEHDPFIGMVIDGKYRIDRKIARGGAGTVYQATHVQLRAPVAVKIIHPRLVSEPMAIERYRREALVTMKVRHTNAIAVMDFGVTPDQIVYVVTELLEGVTLEQRLRERVYLSPLEASNILRQVCAAISVAHENHIIHRDLKPENIFLHRLEGREIVKVMDFGIAKYKGAKEEDEEFKGLTQIGVIVGTPYYMSPEQCMGEEVDERSDVYSLGIVLYQMLTGELPFDADKVVAIVMKHRLEKPLPIYEVRPELPAVVNAVVMRALEKNPADRQQTVAELATELEAAVKAVTERELQSVFLNATEDDLEAAILLATDPSVGFLESPLKHKLFEPGSNDSLKPPDSETEDNPIQQQVDSLLIELKQLCKDMSMLLQLLIENLESNNIPNRSVFDEFKNSVDQMRGLLFAVQKTYYKTWM